MLTVAFPQVSGQDICRIDIRRSEEVVTAKVKDSAGQTVEKVYVRSGASSQEIPVGQIESFLKNRKR